MSIDKVHDSMSGHVYVFGAWTGNIISFIVKSKGCSKCKIVNIMCIKPEKHECVPNCDRVSGVMEGGTTFDLFIRRRFPIFIKTFVLDDDSTICANLLHTTEGGKRPENISLPEFFISPIHRIKVMSVPVFKLVKEGGVEGPRKV